MGDVPRQRNLSPVIWFPALLLAAMALSGCIFGGESERDLSQYFPPPPQERAEQTQEQATNAAAATGGTTDQSGAYTPPAEELENLEVAPSSARFAVQSFFHLVATGDLRSAYQRTSTETRERITLEAFEQRYRDVWAEATINGFTWEVSPQEDENASSHEVIIRYQTTFFGEIEEILQARTLRQPHWVVDWTPNLMFSGLGSPGYLISALIETPPRGRILDRNGVVLAGETEIVIVGVHWDSISDERFVLDFFTERVGVAEEEVRARIYQDVPSYQFIPVAVLALDTSPAVIAEFEQLASPGHSDHSTDSPVLSVRQRGRARDRLPPGDQSRGAGRVVRRGIPRRQHGWPGRNRAKL